MKIQIPKQVGYIIDTLVCGGYEAYAVGGCIRDVLLKRVPEDWDITTSAKPEQVKKLFRRTLDTGILHGTVTVMLEKEGYEVTTYRIDGEYEDARHPVTVEFTSSLLEDLKRRDFTINAMAYSHQTGIVDAFGGMADLENRIIRCVGMAEERFTEDALRIFRAVRFSAQLGFDIEDKTKCAMKLIASNLVYISKERVQVELTKLLMSPHPNALLTAYETGITKVVLPEFDTMMETKQTNAYHCYNVGMHTIKVLESIPADRILRWAALLHDVAKPMVRTVGANGIDHFYGHETLGVDMAEEILRRLKMDNETIRQVGILIKWHDYHFRMDKACIRKVMNRMGDELFPKLLTVIKADTMGKSQFNRQERLNQLTLIEKLYDEILANEDCVSLKDLAVNGTDLIRLGIKPGKEIGVLLNKLLESVIESPSNNKREDLLLRARMLADLGD